MKNLVILSLLTLISCAKFVELTDDEYDIEFSSNSSKKTQILFSHNINGETHPCGCRKFPLGGMEQVYGHLKSTQDKFNQIYLDSGDTFFEVNNLPESLKTSASFKAKKIAEAMDMMGLKYITPGDQDFALGEEFLVDIAKISKFKFLITNSTDSLKIPHKTHAHIKIGDRHIFLLGIVSPEVFNNDHKYLFSSPKNALKTEISKIENKYPKIDKTYILLSHSGMDVDKKLASHFTELDWIIGAHTQSFLRDPLVQNKTQIVQVLSRNHYLGEIILPTNAKAKSNYSLIEVRDELKNLIKDNPFQTWLTQLKAELDKIYAQEDSLQMTSDSHGSQERFKTHASCMECHVPQTEFWQKTSHSIAMMTLLQAREEKNPSCIGCHSLGHKHEKGFSGFKNIIVSTDNKFDQDKYWKEFSQNILTKKSVRSLSKKERLKLSKKWVKFDTSHKVEANFSNVQCLNCHDLHGEHPFEFGDKTARNYESKCIKCHTRDQSPEWYLKDSKGLASSLNKKYFAKKLKEMSCPKN